MDAISESQVKPVGFMDLSGSGKAKIIGIKVARVAVIVLAAAVVATAVWFLAPVVVPAGMFIFGGSMAGLIGGSALLAKVEGMTIKKLNQMETKIYEKAQQLKDPQKKLNESGSASYNKIVGQLKEDGVDIVNLFGEEEQDLPLGAGLFHEIVVAFNLST